MSFRRAQPALLAGAVCLAGLAATGFVALTNPAARVRDAATLQGFQSLARPRLTELATALVHAFDPAPYAAIGALLVIACIARGRPRTGLAIAIVMLGAALTSELLKPALAVPRSYAAGQLALDRGSWPSGHATAAMSVALCAVLAAPRGFAPVVAAAGAALAVGVGYSLLVLTWHFPSDVLGGLLIAATWTALAVAALRAAEVRWPQRTGRELVSARARPMLAPLGLLAGACALVG